LTEVARTDSTVRKSQEILGFKVENALFVAQNADTPTG
jgi:hypothetical protein